MLSTDDFIEFVVLRNSQEYILKVKPNLVESVDQFGNPIEKKNGWNNDCPNNNNINHVKLGPTKLHIMQLKRYFL